MKEQLTKVKIGRKKNFIYGSILITLILEKIQLMQPQHVTLGVAGPRDPRMHRWVELMAIHAIKSLISFSITFFTWL